MTDTALQPAARPARNSNFFGSDGLRAGWGLLLFVVLFVAFTFAGNLMAHKLHPPARHVAGTPHETRALTVFIGEGIVLLAVALATGIMGKVEGRPFGSYGLGGTRKLARFAVGMGWGLFFLSLLVMVLKKMGLLVFDLRLLAGDAIVQRGAIWLGGFFMVALVEETLVRGYLQYTLARGLSAIYGMFHAPQHKAWGFWTAAFLLSLAFGLGHGSNPGESPLGLVSAGTAGLVFCLSLWQTGSLWWAIGFHTTWDWAQSFLYGVADSGTMVQFHLFATHPMGKPILSGGATGPEGSVFILPVLAVVAAVILLTLPKRMEGLGTAE